MRSKVMQMGTESLVFQRASGGRVKIPSPVLAAMLACTQTSGDAPEAGGVLLGRFLRGSEDIVIDDLTTPFPMDRRTRCSFIRQDPRHQAALYRRWIETSGTCNYLGEWHTHPERIPSLSVCDLSNMTRVLQETRFDGDSLLFVVVGIASVAMWEMSRSSSEIIPLPMIGRGRGHLSVKTKETVQKR